MENKEKIMKRLLIYFVLLFFTQIIVLLILGEFKIYEIPYTKSFNTNNNLLVYKSVHSFDFKVKRIIFCNSGIELPFSNR